MSAVAASSSSSHPNTIGVPNSEVFDVFISFRGQDTRNYFTSHVHSALRRKQIKAFIDSEDLRSGDEISGALLEAIEGSKLYLVIFSPEYASSTWCLRELEKILQCRRQHKKQVIPVFHKVDPTHIRHQTGSFGEGFTKAKARAKEEQVQRWKAALKEATDLSGRHQDEHKSESEFIDELVEFVWNELYRLPSSSRDNSKFLVGIDPHVEKVLSSLCLASPQVRSVGLWGMGGVGKTTIAEAVFDCIHTQFQSSHFFRNVREELNRFGEIAFWNKVLSEILEEKNSLNLSLRHHFVRKRLARKRVFIVFDDVESSGLLKLEDLLDHHCLFGAGSKILVTSRDIQVLAKLQVDETCEVVGLKMDDALKLFSKQAFHNECPADGFMELSRGMVEYAEGNPLALKVLGSALIAQDKKYWESELKKMKSFLNKDILDVLRLSFDRLDDGEKDIFLDVACLFQGQEINEVMESLKCSCSSPYYDSAYSCIINLRNKSLLTISDHNTLGVHYLLQEMSWKIEREQSKHRRLQIPVAISSSSSRIMSGMGSSGGFSTAVTDIGGGSNVFGLSATSVLKINKGDITKWFVDSSSDAIVNPANERMLGGGGADRAIHRAAGPELRNACYTVPEVRPEVRCPTGEARITPGFKLPSSHVIHTVGPFYYVGSNPATSLKSAYRNSLVVAKDNNIKYIAFPAISCGTYGYPFEEAATVAISTIKEFPNDFKEVHFVLFADDIYNVWLKKAKELLQS